MSARRVGEAIAKGLQYLEIAQLADGSFATQISRTKRPFRTSITLQTTFAPALMLGALANGEGSSNIRERLAQWLLTQKSPHWSFNYWAKEADERTARAYPDDLDDTFCALIGLYQHNPKMIDSACLASAVKLLLACEKEVGGPYRTWLVAQNAPAAWQDTDLAVNANIAYFLQLTAKPLPNVTAFLDKAIISGKLQSPYYDSWYILVYFVARGYDGPEKYRLIRSLLQKQRQGFWRTPQQTVLAIIALHHLGHHQNIDAALRYIVAAQQKDGSWPAESVWIDEIHGRHKFYAGSPALTTALVLQALSLPNHKAKQALGTVPRKSEPLREQIFGRMNRDIKSFGKPLDLLAKDMLKRIETSDASAEIALLPSIFAQSLNHHPTQPTKQTLLLLGAANTYGWMAYTIYDDFLDDEGDAKLLSVANVAMRRSTSYFREVLPHHVEFQQLVGAAFDRIDAANAWEVLHCRWKITGGKLQLAVIPRFTAIRLAERSIGHTLTPLGVLASLGVNLSAPAAQQLQKGLAHYLVARQLNDDLHDWQEDLARGHCTYVVARLLEDAGTKTGSHNLPALQAQLAQQFWHETLPELCAEARRHIRLAQQAFIKSELFKPNHPLNDLLQNLDTVMIHALQEQRNAQQFLKEYREK